MKLSEAIRLGAMMRPKGRNALWTVGGKQMTVRSCALGAAFDALGCGYEVYGFKPQAIVDVLMEDAKCPACAKKYEGPLEGVIAHLNDWHDWSREKIADWVETVERSLEDAAVGRDDKRVASEITAPTRS